MNLITFPDKTNMNTDPTIPETSKVTDSNINEIKNAINNLIFPIGSIIYNADSTFDPNTVYGGTWVKIEGRLIIGYDASDSDFSTLGATGGSKTHTQTIDEMPRHRHKNDNGDYGATDGFYGVATNTPQGSGGDVYTLYEGNGQPMNIMNPYFVANIWRRTA